MNAAAGAACRVCGNGTMLNDKRTAIFCVNAAAGCRAFVTGNFCIVLHRQGAAGIDINTAACARGLVPFNVAVLHIECAALEQDAAAVAAFVRAVRFSAFYRQVF